MIAGMIASPLLRFEGAALTLAAIVAVAAWGHWKKALFVTLTLALAGASYAAWMIHLNLPILPSSVLVKSKVAAAAIDQNSGSALGDQIHNILTVLQTELPARWLVVGIVLLNFAFLPPRNGQRITVALAVGFAAYAHLLAGRWGWYGRYEIYILATMVGAVVFVWSPVLSNPKGQPSKQFAALVTALAMSLLYVTPLTTSHMAANNIFGQQYQMHRFVTEFFPHKVAVNDLGWVAYRNDEYVLDLWGLGSETARQNRSLIGIDPEWITQLTDQHNVKFAMLYPASFEDKLPQSWCEMGVLKTPHVTSAYDSVSFFLIDTSLKADMEAALAAFSNSLPNGTSYHPVDCGT